MWFFGLLSLIGISAISDVNNNAKRKRIIFAHKEEWGEDVCNLILARTIEIGFTQEMVELALGKSHEMSEHITKRALKERWVYGIKYENATYVSFENGIVTDIKYTKKQLR